MHDFKSLQIDDEDSSKYFINYISDDSDDNSENTNETNDSSDENNDIDVTSLPNSLIITPVTPDLFTNQQLKDEFEQLFRVYDSQITVLYLKFFQRVRITFTSAYKALKARLNLHEYLFHGTVFKTYFACPIVFRGATNDTYLRPPEQEKLFLISPPASPPIGWEQKVEDPPVTDFNILAAVAQLQPNESHELLPSDRISKTPSIVIHTCEDNNETNNLNRDQSYKSILIQTRRPPQNE